MESNKIFIPLSIIVAGLIIAGAVFYSKGTDNSVNLGDSQDQADLQDLAIRPVNDEDNILGSPDADIFLIEYSDYECPFCQRFHPTMEQVMEKYGNDGKVAWVYRHFPIEKHISARPSAEAAECVADLAGNSAFWEYSKQVFEGSPDTLNPASLRSIAEGIGVNGDEFQQCVEEERFKAEVDEDYQEGLKIAQFDRQFGTPYTIVMTKDGVVQGAIPGAQSFAVVDAIIDGILKKGAE